MISFGLYVILREPLKILAISLDHLLFSVYILQDDFYYKIPY